MKVKKALLGMLASMAAGAAIAILLSPEQECERCEKRNKNEQDLEKRLKQKMDQGFDQLLKAVSSAKK
jgi:gas vesicle protein